MRQIKKRSGEIVDFNQEKITNAMRKAFLSMNVDVSEETLRDMTQTVVAQIDREFVDKVPSVEHVQDRVEMILMKQGYLTVAKHYIVYRYEHTKIREVEKQELVERIDEQGLHITTRSGATELYSEEPVRKVLAKYVGEGSPVDVDAIMAQLKYELYEGISTKDIMKALIMVVRSMIERDPAYSKLAARLLLKNIYEEVLGKEAASDAKFAEEHALAFKKCIEHGIAIGRIDERLRIFDIDRLAKAMDLSRDEHFEYLGLQTLYDRYFVRDDATKRVIETPQMFWMRIAMGTAILEEAGKRESYALEFYRVMSDFYYTPSTPTLFHAGTPKPQLSSCYLNTVPDDLHAIFKNYADNAQLSKWSGGIGTDWTPLRATGAFIKGTGVESQGVIPFLKIANDVTVAINRSGRRRGAACVYLECWHYDFMDFAELRKNTGDERRRTHDMDTAAWIPDLFMKRVREGGDWTLFSPDETPELHDLYGAAFEAKYVEYEQKAKEGKMRLHRTLPAMDVWKKIISMLFETGHPWITWKDPSNIRSPQDHVGVVHNSNLCCMTADQRVVTGEGLVTVGYLYEKARMLGHVSKDGKTPLMNGSTNTVFGRTGAVSAGPMLLPRPNAPIVKITTREGYSHNVTPDHKVWVVERGWVEAQELKQGDKIAIQQGEGLFGTTSAPHDAYVCGIVAGDGTFMVREGTTSVMIDVWENEFSLLEEIEQMVGASILAHGEHEFHTSSVRQPRFVGNNLKKRLTSAPLARALAKRGFTHETKLKVPEFVWTGTKETVAAYLRGLYAADATVEASDEVTTCSLASTKKDFLAEIQILLANFGVRSSLTRMREAGTALLPDGKGSSKEYPQGELWRLMVTSIQGCKIMEEITGLGELRGNNKYLANLKKKGDAQKMYATFEELQPMASEDAYCLQVFTEEHSWTVNGLVTKNTEITLNTSADETAVCNLGSLNYAKFVTKGADGRMRFDKELVASVVRTSMRMLDNVIDINYYPTEDAKRSNMRHRPVGLGLRGLHDALYLLNIDFDSEMAVEFSDESMEVISYYAILASSELAKERGTYQTYKGSKWDRGIFPVDTLDLLEKERGETIPVPRTGLMDWTPVREHVKQYGMRNSNTMAVAPTATTANIVGCIPTTEPIYKNLYVKSNQAGDFVVINKYLVEDLKSLGLWNQGMLNRIKYADGSIQGIEEIPAKLRAKYKEVFEIDAKWIIDAAARRSKWIDQSQSLNIFYSGTSGRELSDIYFHAWKLGLKTTYYLRSLGASQVEKSTVSIAEHGATHTRKSGIVSAAMASIENGNATTVVAEVIAEKTIPMAIPSPVEIPQMAVAATSFESSEGPSIPAGFSPEEWKAKLARVASGEEKGVCESCEG